MFREYAAQINAEFGDGCFWVRDFEDELAALPGYYKALFVARDEAGALVGSAAVKHLPDGAAELKRLYVRPAARGTGLGKRSPRRRSTARVSSATRSSGSTRSRRWKPPAGSTHRSVLSRASRSSSTRSKVCSSTS